MKDGLVRTVVKRIALGCFLIDLAATRAIRRAMGEKPHRLAGSCRLCAACCESPMIQTSSLTIRLRTLRWAFLTWHRRVNGFECTGIEPRLRAFVFRCTHFDPATRRCDSYHSRPGMCRDYPRALLWESRPPFLTGCGYRAVAPNAHRMVELLEREGLPPEKIEQLKDKLNLRE